MKYAEQASLMPPLALMDATIGIGGIINFLTFAIINKVWEPVIQPKWVVSGHKITLKDVIEGETVKLNLYQKQQVNCVRQIL